MALQAQQRWWLIGGALGLTLFAMYQVQEAVPDGVAEQHVLRAKHQQALMTTANESLPDLLQKSQVSGGSRDGEADLFKAHAWYVPPLPKPIEMAIEKPIPTAPPVPYFYMGKLEDTPQGTLIFLTARNKVITVAAGQDIDSAWRLDKEDANALYLTYLPLNISKIQPKSAKTAAVSNAITGVNDNQIPND